MSNDSLIVKTHTQGVLESEIKNICQVKKHVWKQSTIDKHKKQDVECCWV